MPITFIDLFCGIGGFHRAFSRPGVECVFANDYDIHSNIVYMKNFIKPGKDYFYPGPLERWNDKKHFVIPKHNILVAGFPCQPFSIAGVSKKNALGRPHGFEDKTQGTLFHDIVRILKKRKPDAFLLENVKNLKYHNGGDTFVTIMGALKEADYIVPEPQVIDGKNFVPQHRERIFIVGFHKRHNHEFEFPEIKKRRYNLIDYLEKEVDEKYTLTPRLWKYLQDYKDKHRKKGNGFGYGLIEPGIDTHTRTISARYYKDGAEALISQGNGAIPRRLTPRECGNLMGFPKKQKFEHLVSDVQAYKQFGNSVIVPVAKTLAGAIIDQLEPLLK